VTLQHPRALALHVGLWFVVLIATVSDGRVEDRGLELRVPLRLLVHALGKLGFLLLLSRFKTLVVEDEHRDDGCVDEEAPCSRRNDPSNFHLAHCVTIVGLKQRSERPQSVGNQEGSKQDVDLSLLGL